MTKYIIAVAVGAILASFSSQAATKFKDSSVLSSGKWVKIKVGETGVYEITGEQLKQFGFSDPKKVKIFGTGGIQTTDNYNKDYTDDLEQVPAMRTGDKLYFYANGLTYEEIRSIDYTTNFDIYRSISKNAYSPASYYFLTDSEDFDARDIETVDTNESNLASVKEWRSNGVVSIWHKNDIVNPTRSGKLFLGEDFSSTKEFEITMSTPGIISGTNVVVNMSAGVKTADSQTVTLSVDGTVLDTKNVSKSADAAIYKLITSFGSTPVTEAMAQAESVTAKVSTSVSLPIAKMNYISVSYKSPLALPADSSQMRWLVKTTKESGLVIGNTTPTTHAWLVFTPNNSPYKIYNTKQYTITTSEGTSCIVPNLGTTAYAEYVIFDTGKQQKQVSFAGNVANQNLHSLATPDMLVITTPKLKAQADRIADFHRQHDGMDVEVVLQDDIFNEFGNGMRDVFAYRQLCKMLYSRNPLKFRYLLLFGSGNYDNRGIFGGDIEETLLTYQTDNSYHSVSSYCSDDYFGVMNDEAVNVEGSNALLNISIGRIPFVSAAEAKTYVDKLLAYMSHKPGKTDTWKSNMLMIGEYGDQYIHTTQTESFIDNFNYEITPKTSDTPEIRTRNDNAVNFNKIYLEPYDNVDNLQATREKLVEDFNVGQNFILFVGHSNISSLTKPTVLMNLQQAIDTKYDVPPVMYFSSCDVGRYDGGQTSFIDKLLLNPDGGIIAAVAATREAYTSLNERLTDSFAKYLGISESDSRFYAKYEKTWGRVLMFAKNFSTDRSRNRLKYHLLGDPAMLVDIPCDRTEVTEVNGVAASKGIAIGAMTPITIKGRVRNDAGEIDTDFNGYAKISLYDSEKYYMTQGDETLTERGAELAVTSADVTAGEFTATIIAPNCITTDDKEKPLQVTAVSNDGTVVSGFYNGLTFDRSLSAVSDDTTAPTINAFYINDKSTFKDGMEVESSLRLKAEVTDDVALNLSHEQIATTAYISIDGGEQVYPVCTYQLDGVDKCIIDQGIYNLKSGRHTAELVVADMSGNVATRTIAFYVAVSDNASLSVDTTALIHSVTFDVENADNYTDAQLVVSDNSGNVVLRTDVGSFPYTWDGSDNNGNRLAEGAYNATAIIDGKSLRQKKIVVVKQ